jgi:hypothetical protein
MSCWFANEFLLALKQQVWPAGSGLLFFGAWRDSDCAHRTSTEADSSIPAVAGENPENDAALPVPDEAP